jgi:hypothetical protein
MDIGHVTPSALSHAASAWADAPAGAEAADVAVEPGQRVDHGVEAAAAQTVARAPLQAQEAHPLPEAQPSTPLADAEFALPADLLVSAALIGLRVEASTNWPLPAQLADPAIARSQNHAVDKPDEEWRTAEHDAADTQDGDGDEQAESAAEEAAATPSEPVAAPATPEHWCEPLSLALRRALAARVTPQALLAAAEQWQRGRCVVLACPQGLDPLGPAWAFVLWPRSRVQAPPGQMAPPLSLFGLRVEARLQWSSPPQGAHWCHVRVVKEHHPRTGRQLVVIEGQDPPADTPLPCEVQLGPVLARSLRWCEVCVRIAAAQRFWTALGAQWSVHVVVSSDPLVETEPATLEDPTC